MKKYVENNFASFRMEKGILHITYKETICLYLPAAMEVVSQRLILQHGKPYPILCDIRGVNDVTGEAREYLVTEGSVLISALALVAKTPLSHLYTEIYALETPPIRLKTFKEETMAMEFLRPFARIPDL
ncbi:MAG: hypothetical protein R2814_14230 [Flavobacteriaceae bacterium]